MGKNNGRRNRIAKIRDVVWDQMSLASNVKAKIVEIASGKTTFRLSVDLIFDKEFEKQLFAASNGKGAAHFIEYCATRGFTDFFADDDMPRPPNSGRATTTSDAASLPISI
jgi:hypothetical protein